MCFITILYPWLICNSFFSYQYTAMKMSSGSDYNKIYDHKYPKGRTVSPQAREWKLHNLMTAEKQKLFDVNIMFAKFNIALHWIRENLSSLLTKKYVLIVDLLTLMSACLEPLTVKLFKLLLLQYISMFCSYHLNLVKIVTCSLQPPKIVWYFSFKLFGQDCY